MTSQLSRTLFLSIVLTVAGCDFFNSPERAQLQDQDIVAARNGLEDALARKIQTEGGTPQEIQIESATLNSTHPNRVEITYRLLYTIPNEPTTLWVHYRGQSTLQAQKTSEAQPLEWHVVQNQQLAYSIDFGQPTSI